MFNFKFSISDEGQSGMQRIETEEFRLRGQLIERIALPEP